MEQELTKEKSQQLADTIESIKLLLFCIDVDYAKSVVKAMHNQAEREDSLAVLNPRYNPAKSNMIHMQANMLNDIVNFIETGKQVDEAKKGIQETESHFDKIAKLFL
jgi:hypothetical protein